ncbi:MAG: hypothetical protein NTX85_00030 [Candidatus Nomurabacteria bacterium]|nr:hypothetical protein [Candidatus Nomurabacteria bacterium]
MKKIFITILVLIALFSIAGVSRASACDMCHVFPRPTYYYPSTPVPTPNPTPTTQPCAITNFTANGSSGSVYLGSGSSANLAWTTNGYCTSGSITNLGAVNSIYSGNQSVYPYVTTTYTLYAYGQNGSDTRTVQVILQTQNQNIYPSVTTYNPSYIGTTTATLSGYATISGGYANAWLEFPCYGNQQGNQYSISSTSLSSPVYNLQSNTVYSYCAAAQATNGGQIVRGNVVSFSTLNTTIQNNSSTYIKTNEVSGLTKTEATLNGTINNPYNYSQNGYFEYGTTVNLGSRTSSKSVGSSSTINFNDAIYGLSEDTIYYYRAVSEGSNGTLRGAIEIFATPGATRTRTIVKNTTTIQNNIKRYKTIYVPVQVEDTAPIVTPPVDQINTNNLPASAFWSGAWLQYGPIFWLLLIIIILLIVILARTYTKKTTTTTVTTHDNHIH